MQMSRMKKRTDISFEDHRLHMTAQDGLTVHHLKKDGTNAANIKFTNVQGVLLVTGDFGNWVFCRSFYPSKDEYVSDGYWIEKLETHSTQKGREYDGEATLALITELLEDPENEWTEEEIEYLEGCAYRATTVETQYREYLYGQAPPRFHGYREPPFCERTRWDLSVVFDAFDHICGLLTPAGTAA